MDEKRRNSLEHSADLHWLAQLRRHQRDLQDRLDVRRAQLGHPSSPISDPIYQRLFFALRRITAQLTVTERSLQRGGSWTDTSASVA